MQLLRIPLVILVICLITQSHEQAARDSQRKATSGETVSNEIDYIKIRTGVLNEMKLDFECARRRADLAKHCITTGLYYASLYEMDDEVVEDIQRTMKAEMKHYYKEAKGATDLTAIRTLIEYGHYFASKVSNSGNDKRQAETIVEEAEERSKT